MKSEAIAFTVTVLGLAGIGAWLVIQDHLWFGLLALVMAGLVRTSNHQEEDK